jgi:hypothetical protein
MKKLIKNLETKVVKNVKAVKGGDGGGQKMFGSVLDAQDAVLLIKKTIHP